MNIIIIIITAIFILFFPGFVWSFIFFDKKSTDKIERTALSFALSIAILPLMVFYTNILGIRISILSVLIQVVLLTLIAFAIILFKEIRLQK